MSLIDDQLAQLDRIDVSLTRQPDFGTFWDEACRACAETPLNTTCETIDYPIESVEVRDLTYAGLDGTRVETWLLLPRNVDGPVPCVIHYHGASGSRGLPHDFMPWLAMGVAVISIDFRMQGGRTGSKTGFTGCGSLYWMTLGIESPKTSYYYCVVADCLRAIELARQAPEIDSARIALEGGSQGGGAGLQVAGLDDTVALCMVDVPSWCWWEQRVFTRAGGGGQIANLLLRRPEMIGQVLTTLSYFDNINHVEKITCPVLVSYGLKDPVCPPECVHAACNKITAPLEMVPYPFGEHGGGGAWHFEKKLNFLKKHFL
jgi:cephalosporin-C deacetylase